MESYILKLVCKDRAGIVAGITTILSNIDGDIRDSAQYGDESTGNFFMRVEFNLPTAKEADSIKNYFSGIIDKYEMDLEVYNKNTKSKILIAVTKESHCLNHLLHHYKSGSLNADIIGVTSNREDLQKLVEMNGLPFHFLSMENGKEAQERELEQLVKQADLFVLARYMQILSSDFCKKYSNKTINIHHSFLPSFKGAKPYKQAYDKGVKMIGATAHFATADLDEGPIIEQDVQRVSHKESPKELQLKGQDIESRVLLEAVKYFTERRILLNGSKTVVFS